MSAKRTYVKYEVVLENPSLGRSEVLYSGPSRSALLYYDAIHSALVVMDVPLDSYLLSVRMCL